MDNSNHSEGSARTHERGAMCASNYDAVSNLNLQLNQSLSHPRKTPVRRDSPPPVARRKSDHCLKKKNIFKLSSVAWAALKCSYNRLVLLKRVKGLFTIKLNFQLHRQKGRKTDRTGDNDDLRRNTHLSSRLTSTLASVASLSGSPIAAGFLWVLQFSPQ